MIEAENSNLGDTEKYTPEPDGMVAEALKLGGEIVSVTPIEKDIGYETKNEILKDTLAGNQEITIDNDGTERDAKTGEVILQGSTD